MEPIQELLEAGERVLGMRLCLHRRDRARLLQRRWEQHSDRACMAVKRDHQRDCADFCGDAVHRRLLAGEGPLVVRCPFGHSELVAPVRQGGGIAAVLFAGPCWTDRAAPPRPGLIPVSDRQWLDDRLTVLAALAGRIAALLPESHPASDRRTIIITWMQYHLEEPITLVDLADHLGLSVSRAGHVVRECCDCTFAELLHRLRLQEAARLLAVTAESISAIAARFVYSDQSHFGHWFRRVMGESPARWRRRHQRAP